MLTILCCHCGREVNRNKKLRHLVQLYCGSKECQSQRKLNSESNKYRDDPSYRIKKLLKARERKKGKSLDGNPQYYSDYQRAYRASHPEYVLRNKAKQRERYARKKDKTSLTTKIVNPDTLMLQQSDNEHLYAMFAIECKQIVNPDALMVERIGNLSFTDKKPMFVRLL